MEREKIPFVVEWIPEISRVVYIKPGRFVASPPFVTKCKIAVYSWRIVFYPNGYNLSPRNDNIPTSDVDDDQMSGEFDDEAWDNSAARTVTTSSKSAIFMVLSPFSTGSTKNVRVRARVQFEISLRENNAPLIGKIEETLFRVQKIYAIKKGDPPNMLNGVREFGPLCKEMVDQFSPISDERLAIMCRLYIDAADFIRWSGVRQKPGKRGRHRNRISQALKVCRISAPVDTENENSEEETRETSYFCPVSVENFDEQIAGKVGDEPDLTIISNDGRAFKCHYRKLSACSNIFAQIFHPDSSIVDNSTRSVTLSDVNEKNWLILLCCIYFGKLPMEAEDSLTEVLYVANKYMIESLLEICSSFMQNNVNNTNVFDYLKASISHNLPDLKEACMNFVYSNSNDLFGANGQNVEVKEKLFAEDENIGMILLRLLADRASQSSGVISFH